MVAGAERFPEVTLVPNSIPILERPEYDGPLDFTDPTEGDGSAVNPYISQTGARWDVMGDWAFRLATREERPVHFVINGGVVKIDAFLNEASIVQKGDDVPMETLTEQLEVIVSGITGEEVLP